MAKPSAPSALRNQASILEVLAVEFEQCKSILEIGSGTGQHAVFFAENLPWLVWQTSDLVDRHDGINAWIHDARLDNVLAPIELDVEHPSGLTDRYDGAFSANTAHIMSIEAVQRMFEVVAGCVNTGGRFCLYGPFNIDGEFTSDSNRQFDANLKSQDPRMGIRPLETLDEFARANALHRTSLYAMPANNMIAVWKKIESGRTE